MSNTCVIFYLYQDCSIKVELCPDIVLGHVGSIGSTWTPHSHHRLYADSVKNKGTAIHLPLFAHSWQKQEDIVHNLISAHEVIGCETVRLYYHQEGV